MPKIEYPPEFLELRKIYPKRPGNPWPKALKAYKARIKQGYSHDEILAGLTRYVLFCDKTGKTGTEFTMQAATFFGKDERWTDEYELPKPRVQDQFKGMSRDQQIEAKAKIMHIEPKVGEKIHEWTGRINSEWLNRYPDGRA